MMVVMMTLGSLCFHRGLHVLRQGFECALRSRRVVRFQRVLQIGEIGAERAVVAEKLGQRICAGAALQVVLKTRQGGLRRGQVPGLDAAANAFKVAEQLVETVRGGGLIRICCRTDAGNIHIF
jgi:hypothetical protein